MVASSGAPLRTDRLRILNEPQLVAVDLDADGLPKAVKRQLRRSGGQNANTAVKNNGGGQEETAAVVETILEMWRIDDEWWRQLISRRYFAVILDGGSRVVLFEDLVTHEWFMQTA
jgi:hypothetical protein